jgi:hypothetical protein
MAYTITLTDGTIFAVVADGTINTSSSQTLVGKNYAGYGDFLNENFIHLLENASNTTAPGAPLTGQLWWDSGNNLLKVYNGTTFKTISAATASGSAPTSNVTGDLWFNTSNSTLNVWTGTAWLPVGPSTVAGTGVQATNIIDNTSTSHPVVTFTIDNDTVAILSQDAAFTPQSSITGWGSGQQVKPGLNLSESGNIYLFQGTATDAQTLDGVNSTQFLRNDQNGNIAGNLVVSGSVGVGSLINNNANGVGNIGSSSTYFNTVFAKATSAQYADVAERFAADAEYEAGTVVELGGSAEITCAQIELSDNVFGVISTRAAYLMNSAAGSDATHPPVAMTGRVPVRVIGQVTKGDRLVSAGNGLARAAKSGEPTAFNVIGRALISKTTEDEGTVEAIVTIK